MSSLPINSTTIHDASLAFCDFVLMTALQVIDLRIALWTCKLVDSLTGYFAYGEREGGRRNVVVVALRVAYVDATKLHKIGALRDVGRGGDRYLRKFTFRTAERDPCSAVQYAGYRELARMEALQGEQIVSTGSHGQTLLADAPALVGNACRKLHLELEAADVAAAVELNGQYCGAAWRNRCILDVQIAAEILCTGTEGHHA